MFSETPGLVFKRDKLSQVCSRFLQLGNDTAIECLINASRGMTKINRSILFDYYLDCHLKNDDPAKALNTWTQMQEEDVTPSDQFLFKLSIYLKGKGLPVPFSVKDGQFETSKDVNKVYLFYKKLEQLAHFNEVKKFVLN